MSVTIVKKPKAVAAALGGGSKVMGIDPSTWTGIVVLDGPAVLHAGVIHTDELTGYARLQLIADSVLKEVQTFQPKHVFIERPITMGKFNAQIQGQIATLIRDRLFTAGVAWWDVSPTTLKKWVAGKGHAKKKEMAVAVQAKWQFTHKSDDVIDAYALAKMGQHVLQTGPMKGVQYADERVQAERGEDPPSQGPEGSVQGGAA